MSGMSSLTGYKGWRPMHVGPSKLLWWGGLCQTNGEAGNRQGSEVFFCHRPNRPTPDVDPDVAPAEHHGDIPTGHSFGMASQGGHRHRSRPFHHQAFLVEQQSKRGFDVRLLRKIVLIDQIAAELERDGPRLDPTRRAIRKGRQGW